MSAFILAILIIAAGVVLGIASLLAAGMASIPKPLTKIRKELAISSVLILIGVAWMYFAS